MEEISQVFTMYFQLWSGIPLYVIIPLVILVVWFICFKYKAPQRILVMWCASWYSMLIKTSDMSDEEKKAKMAFAETMIQKALDNKLEDEPSVLGGKG